MQLDKDGIAMSPPASEVDEFEAAETSSTERAPSTNPATLPEPTAPKLPQGEAKQWSSQPRKKPLTLLELPVDILGLIIKKITYTNDLTSLALTNSTLHTLAIPHIYARFDIVWPDAHMTPSDTKSVDALTYGLSTLSLGSTFSRLRQRLARRGSQQSSRPPFNLGGNNYAAHTRKFSLGNGPKDWVAEYMITKESGKMLGTLVAMAVAKMENLETFVWDMPTGVLAEIFLALASLPDHHKNGECNLERVWIRWHDNSDAATDPLNPAAATSPVAHVVKPTDSAMTHVGVMIPSNTNHQRPKPAIPYSESTVEYPTFSVLPPLRSLTVLDIDEIAYLDEMAMLIERSQDRLRELRVGISPKVQHEVWTQTWDGPELQQVDHDAHWPGASTIGQCRLGGVLGTLVGRIYDIRRRPGARTRERPTSVPNHASSHDFPDIDSPPAADNASGQVDGAASAIPNGEGQSTNASSEQPLANGSEQKRQEDKDDDQGEVEVPGPAGNKNGQSPGQGQSAMVDAGQDPNVSDQEKAKGQSKSNTEATGRKRLEGKLRLRTLELERISLSIQVCSRAIDWTTLTNLTILDCAQHETLWKLLRRQFQPTRVGGGYRISSSTRQSSTPQFQYHLGIKSIHTNMTSGPLISFIKETLAPNTLEVLFLQDRRRGVTPPTVTIDAIFKGALKRHRLSLQKLLLDSSAKITSDPPSRSPEHTRWSHWVLTTEMVLYITSGRMSNLKELAASLAYTDWHTFLQRLPNLAQLKSLHIPYIRDHLVKHLEPKEIALQIADIITLRPEIQLSYIGISTRCFEVLETPAEERGSGLSSGGMVAGPGSVVGENDTAGAMNNAGGLQSENESAESDDEPQDDTSEEEDGDETEDEDGIVSASPASDGDETQSEGQSYAAGDSDDDDGFIDPDDTPVKTRLRLREILFYDDKVAIFKARHGRL